MPCALQAGVGMRSLHAEPQGQRQTLRSVASSICPFSRTETARRKAPSRGQACTGHRARRQMDPLKRESCRPAHELLSGCKQQLSQWMPGLARRQAFSETRGVNARQFAVTAVTEPLRITGLRSSCIKRFQDARSAPDWARPPAHRAPALQGAYAVSQLPPPHHSTSIVNRNEAAVCDARIVRMWLGRLTVDSQDRLSVCPCGRCWRAAAALLDAEAARSWRVIVALLWRRGHWFDCRCPGSPTAFFLPRLTGTTSVQSIVTLTSRQSMAPAKWTVWVCDSDRCLSLASCPTPSQVYFRK